jgi:hypothetical protein
MGFLGRWFSDTLRLALALAGAVALMQAPAMTREYAAALQQVSEDAQRDVEQREASARRFYGISAPSGAPFIAALTPFEPSNAETLALSLRRVTVLRGVYERIAAAPALLQPVVAAFDALDDEHGYKAAVLHTLARTYAVQVSFGVAPAVYGLLGLFLGTLLSHLGASGARRAHRAIQRRRVRAELRA